MLFSVSPPSPHQSGALRARAPFSSCLPHLRSVAQDLEHIRQSTNTDLDCFSDETSKNSERTQNGERVTGEQTRTSVGMCLRRKWRGAEETDAGVVGSQSPSPASGDGDGGARLETGLQGHPPTRGPAVWTGHPGSPRQQKLWVLSLETVRSPTLGSCSG